MSVNHSVPHEGVVAELVDANINFAREEEATLARWEEINAFQTSLELSEGRPEFTFYDGPPFATGLPHYGHILAGTIKDVVTRYASQTGFHVNRRFGWDCHGLPVEFEIDKKLGITSKDQVMEMGIAAYNEECRGIVTRYCKEWETIVNRLGRWIDFENDYKTLEPWYMESVWWVFRQLFDKGLVYRGYKVMPYSTACTTPLSNFEANLNYKDAADPAVVASFPLVSDPAVSLLAWTTTPWTLPSNLALCVNPEMDYVKVRDVATEAVWILAEDCLSSVYPGVAKKKYKGGEFEVLEKFKGETLRGVAYTPLFDFFEARRNEHTWTVQVDDYVVSGTGTGVVHQAPAFGEDDYRVCLAGGVIVKGEAIVCPVNDDGCFTTEVSEEFAGQHVKAADPAIIAHLKGRNRIVRVSSIIHSVPFCWRSDTPLIYKAVPSWFVSVETIKERLVANNNETYWVPSNVKEKRFHNWLVDARDWAISRSRYWGTPLPVWVSDDMEEVVCVQSIDELEELSGVRVDDLHRHFVDDITIPSRQGKGDLHRVADVFDCWFESGSMPYAQAHYPFENAEKFEQGFPADFIAEGLDQTRGWFYTLMVISTALFDKPAFKNLIVNGLVLAGDGKKMSKRLKNYPDPTLVVDQYGADPLRLYLINSPVVRAEPLRFKEDGVRGVVKDVFLPWFHAFRFFVGSVQRLELSSGFKFAPDVALAQASDNVMDTWILASFNGLVKFVREEMAAYRLYTVVPRLVNFLTQLTNWYVRLNRDRLKGADGDDQARVSLAALYEVLMSLSLLMAPFTPFFAEYTYQRLRLMHADVGNEAAGPSAVGRAESVHYCSVPEFDEACLDEQAEARMKVLQMVVELARVMRERNNLSLKQPLPEVIVVAPDAIVGDAVAALGEYIRGECNVVSVRHTVDEQAWCQLSAKGDGKSLGMRFGRRIKELNPLIAAMTHDQVSAYSRDEGITLGGEFELGPGDLHVQREFKGDAARYDANTSAGGGVMVVLDKVQTPELVAQGVAREVVNLVQKLRKSGGLVPSDDIDVWVDPKPATRGRPEVLPSVEANLAAVVGKLRARPLHAEGRPAYAVVLGSVESPEIGTVSITRPAPVFLAPAALAAATGASEAAAQLAAGFLASRTEAQLRAMGATVSVDIDGATVALTAGEHFWYRPSDQFSA